MNQPPYDYGNQWTDKEAACLLLLTLAAILQLLTGFFGYAGAPGLVYAMWGAWGFYCYGRFKWRPRPPEKHTIDVTPGWEEALPEKTYKN